MCPTLAPLLFVGVVTGTDLTQTRLRNLIASNDVVLRGRNDHNKDLAWECFTETGIEEPERPEVQIAVVVTTSECQHLAQVTPLTLDHMMEPRPVHVHLHIPYNLREISPRPLSSPNCEEDGCRTTLHLRQTVNLHLRWPYQSRLQSQSCHSGVMGSQGTQSKARWAFGQFQ